MSDFPLLTLVHLSRCFKVGKKATTAQATLKTQEVYGMLTTGHSRGDIVRICSDQWNCSERQVDNYIAKARKLLEEDCEMARPAYLAELLARLRYYEQKAAKRGQYQVAVNSATQQAKLIGLEGA